MTKGGDDKDYRSRSASASTWKRCSHLCCLTELSRTKGVNAARWSSTQFTTMAGNLSGLRIRRTAHAHMRSVVPRLVLVSISKISTRPSSTHSRSISAAQGKSALSQTQGLSTFEQARLSRLAQGDDAHECSGNEVRPHQRGDAFGAETLRRVVFCRGHRPVTLPAAPAAIKGTKPCGRDSNPIDQPALRLCGRDDRGKCYRPVPAVMVPSR
jgi:hypothetical protein